METQKRKKVLIAPDYDPTAQKVAEAGYAMAKAMNAEVTLIHIILDPVYYSSIESSLLMGHTDAMGIDPFQFGNADRLQKMSQHFLDNSKKHLGDSSIKTLIMEGDFAKSILNAANKMNADTIVMGSHSRRWLEDIVMGSVTEKVLRDSSIPLYIIPTKKRY